ncbi:MAG: hypothetical protein L0Z50_36410 [Verrucomicrobiales bacterium]|nr:hypothetical protein [Verrucomicrobiales bacterium]
MIVRNTILYKAILLVLTVAFLASVGMSQRYLNRQRDALGLTRVAPLENAPPVLAFTTVALGGFRGLIANALWIRANDLQEADKYFEMVQLADWITTLQPHFTTVWVHQAWNMAYNISIKFSDMNDRWLWVLRGIELLRDRGLRFNPKEPLIYRELAWFYQHKLGQNLDDGHEFYKHVWADEMQKVLGSGHPNFDELLTPPTSDVRDRVKTLREKYKLEPKFMKEVDETYGPLEWRLPETHAIYWGYVGLKECPGARQEDLVQLRRNIFQSMQTAFHRGRMIFVTKGSFDFTYGPNIEIIPKVSKAYEEMIEQEPNVKENLQNGHKNFLKTAVYFLYTHNRLKSADEWFKYLQQLYPLALLTPEQLAIKQSNPEATFPPMSLDEYAVERVAEEVGDGGVDRTKAILEGYIHNALMSLAIGDDERAAGFERYAQLIWQNYMSRMSLPAAQKRVGLPPMADLRKEVRDQLLDRLDEENVEVANQLRSALGLPAPSANASVIEGGAQPTEKPATNQPPTQPGAKK